MVARGLLRVTPVGDGTFEEKCMHTPASCLRWSRCRI